jgi:rhodanese-related sulfurtransferase
MNPFAQLAIIGGISAAAAAGTWAVKGRPVVAAVVCDPAQIGPDEICLADVPDGVQWIDARPREEWEKNGLEGSVLWNLDPKEDPQLMEAEAAMKMISARLVVVYCGSKGCDSSRYVADRARNLGLGPPVKVLYGGWDALRDSN